MATVSSGQNAQACFHYWSRKEPLPFADYHSIVNGTNPGLKDYVTEVRDIRTSQESFDWSTHGFQVVHQALPFTHTEIDYFDVPTLASRYWPGLVSTVKSQLKARSVVVFNKEVRLSSKEGHTTADRVRRTRLASAEERHKPIKPYHIVHSDHTIDGSRSALRAILPSFFDDVGGGSNNGVEAEEQTQFFQLRQEILAAEDAAIRAAGLASHLGWDGTGYTGPRWATFSIWRPLATVHRDPLAVMDATSMFALPSTFAEKREVYTYIANPHHGRPGFADYESASVMPILPPHNGNSHGKHKWYWLSNQQPDEVLFLKIFDSEAWLEGSTVAPCAPHSAFSLAGQDDGDSSPRLSIETRVYVIW